MVVFPLIAFVVSLCCMAVIGKDTLRRPRPDRIVWTIAFAIFAIAAGAEMIGSLSGWTPAIVRIYYVTGAVLVVGYLALGELYLLASSRISKFAPGVMWLITALAITLVLDAPVDERLLAHDGWEALERNIGLTAVTLFLNIGGSLILIAGALWSAWKFRKLGTQRRRMIGCILIALGTFIVASGGTVTRLGHREYLYIAMSIGIAVIFAGVLETRRSDQDSRGLRALLGLNPREDTGKIIPFQPGIVSRNARGNDAQALDYLIERLLPLDEAALDRNCREWSVDRLDIDALERSQAHQVWSLRTRLDPAAQQRLDELSPATRAQLAELYFEVFRASEHVGQTG
ncbi:MAG: hypothetical protein M9947_09410 [Thermomicrobiales bacterium]|nr:hypothetical protein [Thermomicrobiales bacterium]